MNIVISNQATQNIILELTEQSKAYPRMGDLKLQDDSGAQFAIVLRRDGKILGGAVAMINLDWAYVGTLWVDDSLRGKGVGKRLMMAVESYAHQQGLNGVYLYTIDFQAPDFYHKIGYEVLGTLANRPHGHTATYYAKTDLAIDGLTEEFDLENPATEKTSNLLGSGLDHDANEVAPLISYERLFLLQDDDKVTQGGLFAHEFWGWLEVHLCYATSTEGLLLLLEAVEAYCDNHQVGMVLPSYEVIHHQLLQSRGYQQWSTLQDRPTGTSCTFWIRNAYNS